MSDALDELAQRSGIASDYLDYRGEPKQIGATARRAIMRSMGLPLDAAQAEQVLAERDAHEAASVLDATLLGVEGQPLLIKLWLSGDHGLDRVQLKVDTDQGDWEFEFDVAVLPRNDDGSILAQLKPVLPAGRHRVVLLDGNREQIDDAWLLIAPPVCYRHDRLERAERLAGVSVQLYSVRSARNWGIGDFGDLKTIISGAADAGMALVSVNPLHALFPANPHHISPYSPSSRSFLNVLYIDVEAMPEYVASTSACDLVSAAAFQARLDALRAVDRVDYPGVAACKFEVLEQVYRDFAAQQGVRWSAFRCWAEEAGEALHLHALYDALHEHFFRQDMQWWGWPVWPEAYRSPTTHEVAAFAAEHADRVQYFEFLQWVAEEQLRDAQQHALDAGMEVGIYLDLAVGVDNAGSETWANREVFCLEASAGAPPDLLARQGQDWGFPPMRPDALRESGYALFLQNLRASMRHAGAVRFDHAVSLMQLWWIPRPGSAADGAYVYYAFDELMATIRLESQRNQCLVIAEDLGTVPPRLSEELMRAHCFSYRILFFEKIGDRFREPAAYDPQALAALTTHDLPTMVSWWAMSDIQLRIDIGLFTDPAFVEEFRAERLRDKQALLDLLVEQGLWQGERDAAAIASMDASLGEAVHALLGRTASALVLCQLEDLLLEPTPVNIPGTLDEYPNWQRKLALPLEQAFEDPGVRSTMAAIVAARRD